MTLVLRTAERGDWEAIRDIYVQGIESGDATFEISSPDWERWDASHLHFARLVAQSAEEVVGWAALSPVSARAVYSGVAEVSVYVASSWRGKGIGRALLGQLIIEAEQNGIWTLQASIFPENEASISIHEKFGFRKVGLRERIGRQHGNWRSTILFERRSQNVGCD